MSTNSRSPRAPVLASLGSATRSEELRSCSHRSKAPSTPAIRRSNRQIEHSGKDENSLDLLPSTCCWCEWSLTELNWAELRSPIQWERCEHDFNVCFGDWHECSGYTMWHGDCSVCYQCTVRWVAEGLVKVVTNYANESPVYYNFCCNYCSW